MPRCWRHRPETERDGPLPCLARPPGRLSKQICLRGWLHGNGLDRGAPALRAGGPPPSSCPWHPAGILGRDPGRCGTEPSHQPTGSWALRPGHVGVADAPHGRKHLPDRPLAVPPGPRRRRRIRRRKRLLGAGGTHPRRWRPLPCPRGRELQPGQGVLRPTLPGQGGLRGELRLLDAGSLPGPETAGQQHRRFCPPIHPGPLLRRSERRCLLHLPAAGHGKP